MNAIDRIPRPEVLLEANSTLAGRMVPLLLVRYTFDGSAGIWRWVSVPYEWINMQNQTVEVGDCTYQVSYDPEGFFLNTHYYYLSSSPLTRRPERPSLFRIDDWDAHEAALAEWRRACTEWENNRQQEEADHAVRQRVQQRAELQELVNVGPWQWLPQNEEGDAQ